MRVRPFLSFAAVVLLWASTPTLVDRLYEENVGTLFLLTSATVFSSAVLLIGAAVTGGLRELRSFRRRDWAIVAGMGMLGIVGYLSFYYLAFRFAPPDEVNVVNYLWPVLLVVFAGPVLGERHDRWTWLGIALSFVGAAGIVTDWKVTLPNIGESGGARLVGYLLAAAGAVCWALFSVIGKRLRYGKMTAMAFYCLVGAVVFGTALIVGGGWQWPSGPAWARLAFLGGVVNGIAYVLWFEALAGGPTALFGNLVFLTPFLSLVYLRLFADVPLRPAVWVSLILIVAGSLISLNRASRMAGHCDRS